MVGTGRFELPTPRTQGECITPLAICFCLLGAFGPYVSPITMQMDLG